MILLDTNALLWLYRDAADLGPAARHAIDTSGRVHYSSASILEITVKNLLGRIELPGGAAYPRVFDESGLVELPFTSRHAAALAAFPALARHDPFDRMLLAQAKVESLDLLTSDAVLLGLGETWVRDARR
ncbi:type II toxin-antitoxin system VapC family toxin [Microbacterium sp. NEAU-LLC]|uniref:Type II toxin-antitoxin system VapC family toxin n=1 Tax=Microbacterium helvum TaxID=2773713 RepID=A0ABR8NNK0_9MICO|nr:type II toxin-antitoxin system VapC family toxin [Microbacterium helvum]MBD3942240.1 type II toxin-antitoxin system VapC family toxin [Microbacterium helvum]